MGKVLVDVDFELDGRQEEASRFRGCRWTSDAQSVMHRSCIMLHSNRLLLLSPSSNAVLENDYRFSLHNCNTAQNSRMLLHNASFPFQRSWKPFSAVRKAGKQAVQGKGHHHNHR